MLAFENAAPPRRQLQDYWHVMQVDDEAVRKALGNLEEGWRDFEEGDRNRMPSQAAAPQTPSPDQVGHSGCRVLPVLTMKQACLLRGVCQKCELLSSMALPRRLLAKGWCHRGQHSW